MVRILINWWTEMDIEMATPLEYFEKVKDKNVDLFRN